MVSFFAKSKYLLLGLFVASGLVFFPASNLQAAVPSTITQGNIDTLWDQYFIAERYVNTLDRNVPGVAVIQDNLRVRLDYVSTEIYLRQLEVWISEANHINTKEKVGDAYNRTGCYAVTNAARVNAADRVACVTNPANRWIASYLTISSLINDLPPTQPQRRQTLRTDANAIVTYLESMDFTFSCYPKPPNSDWETDTNTEDPPYDYTVSYPQNFLVDPPNAQVTWDPTVEETRQIDYAGGQDYCLYECDIKYTYDPSIQATSPTEIQACKNTCYGDYVLSNGIGGYAAGSSCFNWCDVSDDGCISWECERVIDEACVSQCEQGPCVLNECDNPDFPDNKVWPTNNVIVGVDVYDRGATTTSWTEIGAGAPNDCEWRCADDYISCTIPGAGNVTDNDCVDGNCQCISTACGNGPVPDNTPAYIEVGAPNFSSCTETREWTHVSGTPGACEFSCAAGYHPYNNTCVSNQCTGTAPTGTGVIPDPLINNETGPEDDWTFTSSVPSGECEWGCDENYEQDGDTCVPMTQSVTCGGSEPTHSNIIKGSSPYTQTWDGTDWAPTPTNSSWTRISGGLTDACQWRCADGYYWTGSGCRQYVFFTPVKTQGFEDILVLFDEASATRWCIEKGFRGFGNYDPGFYNSSFDCRSDEKRAKWDNDRWTFNNSANYFGTDCDQWINSITCTGDTATSRTENCGGSRPTVSIWNGLSSYTQFFNQTTWEPTKSWIVSDRETSNTPKSCEWKCSSNNNGWDGTVCKRDTWTRPYEEDGTYDRYYYGDLTTGRKFCIDNGWDIVLSQRNESPYLGCGIVDGKRKRWDGSKWVLTDGLGCGGSPWIDKITCGSFEQNIWHQPKGGIFGTYPLFGDDASATQWCIDRGFIGLDSRTLKYPYSGCSEIDNLRYQWTGSQWRPVGGGFDCGNEPWVEYISCINP